MEQLFDDLEDFGAFDDAMRISALEDGWGDLLDVYEIGTVLWESGAPLERWRLL